MRTTILVADDEAPMRKYISSNLKVRGYDILMAADGNEALKVAGEHTLDLVLLDMAMPGPDGTQVLAALRRDGHVPVIVVSARGREHDKVQALDLGADDYLTKPFGVHELLARVRATLRRSGSVQDSTLPAYVHAELEVDFAGRRVRVAGRDVSLTAKQYDVLAYLARNAGKVLQLLGVAALGYASYAALDATNKANKGTLDKTKPLPAWLPLAGFGLMGIGLVIDIDAGHHLRKR